MYRDQLKAVGLLAALCPSAIFIEGRLAFTTIGELSVSAAKEGLACVVRRCVACACKSL